MTFNIHKQHWIMTRISFAQRKGVFSCHIVLYAVLWKVFQALKLLLWNQCYSFMTDMRILTQNPAETQNYNIRQAILEQNNK